jgi:hypothetical protein
MRERCDAEKYRSRYVNCRGYSLVESNSKETVSGKPRNVWREALVMYLEIVFQNMPGETGEDLEKTCQNG